MAARPRLPVHELQSAAQISELTDDLLSRDDALLHSIVNVMTAHRELGDLIPQTVSKFGSGHFFPFSESEFELSNSLLLARYGFYRYAFVALRSVLELGLLSVYW